MRVENVKNTIFKLFLNNLTPDLCYGCGKQGVSLCDYCKYDIENEPFLGCFVCNLPSKNGVCKKHNSHIDSAWIVSKRTGATRNIVGAYKFQRNFFLHDALSELIDRRLPNLPKETVVVPVPSRRSSVRRKGYDHTLELASSLARRRGWQLSTPLRSVQARVQHEISKSERLQNTADGFRFNDQELYPDRPYLIIDDIVTTGATANSVAQLLKKQGVKTVWLAAIARQPIDE